MTSSRRAVPAQDAMASTRGLNFYLEDLSRTGPLQPLTQGGVLHGIVGDAVGDTLRLRTPAGVIETWVEENGGTLIVGADRTARTIATTTIHLPEAPPAAATDTGAGTTPRGGHHD